ncbi:sensor histidine kinase [Burkholderia stabilis]|nr:ATP-binding protein [Burkholderia stabilis]
MPEQQADTYLRPFMRYQRVLIYGGGVLVTLAIFAALAFHMVSIVERYVARERHDLAFDLQHIGDETAQIDAILRNNALNGELMWQQGAMPPNADVDQFFRDNRVFSLRSHPTILVIGITAGTISRTQVAQVIRFAVNMAPLLDVIASRHGAPISAYAVSANRTLAVLSLRRPPTGAELARLVADRQALGRQLTDQLPATTDRYMTDHVPSGLRSVHWLKPSSDLLTGLPIIRLATTVNDSPRRRAPLFDVVFEFPSQLVTASLPQARFNGAFAVLAKGDVIASTATNALTRTALEHALQTLPTWPPSGSVAWSLGSLMILERFGTTDWSLVYVVPWQTILGELDSPVIATLTTSLGIIALIWILLLVFDHNVFRPTLAAAIRVSESEHLNRVLISTAPIGLALIDMDTAVPLLRSPMMTALEATMSNRSDKAAAELVHHYERVMRKSARADESGQPGSVTDILAFERVGAAPMKAALRMAPARYQGRNVLVVTLADVTTEQELQVKLAEAHRAAEASNAAKSAFLATTSHEIRTPLHAMLGNLDFLARSDLDTSQRDRLCIIQEAGQQLARIIDDILDLSKIESGDMQYENIAFDIVTLIEQELVLYLPNAQLKSVAFLHIFRAFEPRWLIGDPTRIAQIIRNLLSNAIKFTDQGKIVVILDISPGTDPASSSVIELGVQDTGIGIESEHQAAVFDAFRQVDGTVTRRFGGTGLGLSLCKRLAAGMSGSISVDSTPGIGSRFCLRIPAVAALHPASDERTGSLAGKTVILATSHPEWTEHATNLLTRWGE